MVLNFSCLKVIQITLLRIDCSVPAPLNTNKLPLSGEMECFHREAQPMQFTPVMMTGAESEQSVGASIYQFVGCRDNAGHVCLPHSVSWSAQGRLGTD